MDLIDFFEPVALEKFLPLAERKSHWLGNRLVLNAHNWEDNADFASIKIALIGADEDRNGKYQEACKGSADAVRSYLYKLSHHDFHFEIADLGNLKPGHEIGDTYFAIQTVAAFLIEKGVLPILIGGSNDLAYAMYKAYAQLQRTVNFVAVDSIFDLAGPESTLDGESYLTHLLMQQPNYIFNYSNIGYQSYLIDPMHPPLLNKLNFDYHRLGNIQAQPELMEPIVRNADFIAFDISAIRQSEAPGCYAVGPNGFYGEEACQLTRYAGLSDKLSAIGFFEFHPQLDRRGQTAHLVAQMIWYFIEGFANRKNDFPFQSPKDYTKFRVMLHDDRYEIIFYKSHKSDRWWMEVPYPVGANLPFERHYTVPCSYEEYQQACQDEMPDRWWKTFQKLS